MPLWDKVKLELDRAGRVAQEAIDEGRIRIEAFRARELADKAAERLGYAVSRARSESRAMDDPEIERLYAALAEHEAEATRLKAELDAITRRTPRADDTAAADTADTTSSMGDTGTSSSGSSTSAASSASSTAAADASPLSTDPAERAEWDREHL